MGGCLGNISTYPETSPNSGAPVLMVNFFAVGTDMIDRLHIGSNLCIARGQSVGTAVKSCVWHG